MMLRKTILTILVGFLLIITIYVVDTINGLKNNNITFEISAIIYNDLEKNLMNNKFYNNIEKLKIINDIENLTKTNYGKLLSLKLIKKENDFKEEIIKLNKENNLVLSCHYQNPFCMWIKNWYFKKINNS